jgi:hypothetical protein
LVSCPDWSRLAAAHDARDEGLEPEGWAEAVAHFDTCSLCRKEALKADPLLVFRRMPGVEITPAEENLEVESMQQAVAAMRTARRLETRGRFAGWRRWAAAAVLAGVSLGMGDRAPQLEQAVEATPAPAAVSAASAASVAFAASVPSEQLLDGIDRPEARVYQMDSDGMSTAMIIDPSFGENLDV